MTLAQYYETYPPPWPSRIAKRPLPSLSNLSSIMYSNLRKILYGLPSLVWLGNSCLRNIQTRLHKMRLSHAFEIHEAPSFHFFINKFMI